MRWCVQRDIPMPGAQARAVRSSPRIPPADPFRFVLDCHFAAPDFWERFTATKARGAAVFYFWGHSYEMLTEADWARMDRLLAELAADPEVEFASLEELFPAA